MAPHCASSTSLNVSVSVGALHKFGAIAGVSIKLPSLALAKGVTCCSCTFINTSCHCASLHMSSEGWQSEKCKQLNVTLCIHQWNEHHCGAHGRHTTCLPCLSHLADMYDQQAKCKRESRTVAGFDFAKLTWKASKLG